MSLAEWLPELLPEQGSEILCPQRSLDCSDGPFYRLRTAASACWSQEAFFCALVLLQKMFAKFDREEEAAEAAAAEEQGLHLRGLAYGLSERAPEFL